jgi:hypothetical protein
VRTFAVGFDDPGIRGIRGLPFAGNVGDFVSLDNHHGIANGRAAVAIDQSTAFDDQRRGLLRVCGMVEKIASRRKTAKRRQVSRCGFIRPPRRELCDKFGPRAMEQKSPTAGKERFFVAAKIAGRKMRVNLKPHPLLRMIGPRG